MWRSCPLLLVRKRKYPTVHVHRIHAHAGAAHEIWSSQLMDTSGSGVDIYASEV